MGACILFFVPFHLAVMLICFSDASRARAGVLAITPVSVPRGCSICWRMLHVFHPDPQTLFAGKVDNMGSACLVSNSKARDLHVIYAKAFHGASLTQKDSFPAWS